MGGQDAGMVAILAVHLSKTKVPFLPISGLIVCTRALVIVSFLPFVSSGHGQPCVRVLALE